MPSSFVASFRFVAIVTVAAVAVAAVFVFNYIEFTGDKHFVVRFNHREWDRGAGTWLHQITSI